MKYGISKMKFDVNYVLKETDEIETLLLNFKNEIAIERFQNLKSYLKSCKEDTTLRNLEIAFQNIVDEIAYKENPF